MTLAIGDWARPSLSQKFSMPLLRYGSFSFACRVVGQIYGTGNPISAFPGRQYKSTKVRTFGMKCGMSFGFEFG